MYKYKVPRSHDSTLHSYEVLCTRYLVRDISYGIQAVSGVAFVAPSPTEPCDDHQSSRAALPSRRRTIRKWNVADFKHRVIPYQRPSWWTPGHQDQRLAHIHTHVHTDTHIHTHACTHTYTRMHSHIYMRVCIHACAHADVLAHIHTCMHSCTHTCACTHSYTNMHACMQTCTHAYMHTHAYTHSHMCAYMHA